jgi:hypothetical protein
MKKQVIIVRNAGNPEVAHAALVRVTVVKDSIRLGRPERTLCRMSPVSTLTPDMAGNSPMCLNCETKMKKIIRRLAAV